MPRYVLAPLIAVGYVGFCSAIGKILKRNSDCYPEWVTRPLSPDEIEAPT